MAAPRAAAPARADAPRFRFVGGKGGVGKTTWAAAQAIAAADAGRRVLLVSTDPAHSLADVLGAGLGRAPRRLAGLRPGRLSAVELDADRALARWLARHRRHLRTIAERGTYLDEEDVERLLRLSFPGVDELMGLLELGRLARAAGPEDVVVDTAPTGHTLRLLAMPGTLRRVAAVLDDMHAKHRFLAGSLGAGYAPDAADRLIAELDAGGRAWHALLRDPARASFTWLLLPEAMALAEAATAIEALASAGLEVGEIVVNRVAPAPRSPCPPCRARVRVERVILAAAAEAFAGRRLLAVAARNGEPRGVRALRALARAARALRPGRDTARGPVARPGGRPASRSRVPRGAGVPSSGAPAPAWLESLAPPGVRLLVFLGKGGVGKTTTATAAALALAAHRPGARVLLLSTDPAHSLGDVLAVPVGDVEAPVPGAPARFRARELDAGRAFAQRRDRYRAAVDALFDALLKGSRLDVAYDRQVVEELIDLAPPGLDEVFGVLAVTEALLEREPAPYDVVVVDSAPTGHALRLLAMPAAALAWTHALLAILLKYRNVLGLGDFAADLLATARHLRILAALLVDADRCRAIVVTRPAHLPRLETERLLARLRRLAIPIGAILVDAVTCGACAACRQRRRDERRLMQVLGGRGIPVLAAPALAPPPCGPGALVGWGRLWEEVS